MKSVDVRKRLTDALRLDLIGPEEHLGSPEEVLPEPPSRWYLAGFLVPLDANEEQKADEAGVDELDTVNDAKGLDDAVAPEPAPARRSFFPSSVGMSFLLPDKTKQLRATVRWADYKPVAKPPDEGTLYQWQRIPHAETLSVTIPSETSQPAEQEISGSRGLKLALSVRSVQSDGAEGGIPKGTRSV